MSPRKRSLLSLVALFCLAACAQTVLSGELPPDCADRLQLISKAPGGAMPDGAGTDTAMTPDGRFVVFSSAADNIVPNDTNHATDVFVLNRVTNTVENVHVSSAGDQANDDALGAGFAITPDGRFVAYSSYATNLGGDAAVLQVFVHDRQTHETELISQPAPDGPAFTHAGSPAISDDGRYVAYFGLFFNNVAQVYLYDRQLATTTLISKSPDGEAGDHVSGTILDGLSIFLSGGQIAMSSDARFICYPSDATNLVSGHDLNTRDVYVYDRQSDTTELISVGYDGSPANDSSLGVWSGWIGPDNVAMSADGRYVAFDSAATNLVENDANSGPVGLFIRDRQLQTTTRLPLPESNLLASPLFSLNGRYLFFVHAGDTMPVPGYTGGLHRFRYDLQTDSIAALYAEGFGASSDYWTSATPGATTSDGETVVFPWTTPSIAQTNYVPHTQIFLRQLASPSDADCNLNLIPDACEPAYGDIAMFTAALIDGSPDAAVFCLFDRNDDGRLNGLDVGPFMHDLLAGG